MYDNNNACTVMSNVQKPTACTQHMDIRNFALAEYVDQDI
ncbi:hypothetical protein ACHAW6_002235 [Cyclotella cf. meneghiniana]